MTANMDQTTALTLEKPYPFALQFCGWGVLFGVYAMVWGIGYPQIASGIGLSFTAWPFGILLGRWSAL